MPDDFTPQGETATTPWVKETIYVVQKHKLIMSIHVFKTVVEKKDQPPAAANDRDDRVAGQRRRRGADMMRRRMQEQDDVDDEGL